MSKRLRVTLAAACVLTCFAFGERSSAAVVTFETVVKTGDPIPNSGGLTYARVNGTTLSGGTVAFLGRDSDTTPTVTGIYSSTGGTISTVVTTNTAIPSGTGNFTGFGSVTASNGTLAFDGNGASSQSGVYTVPLSGGSPSVVVNTATPIPGGSGNFTAVFSSNLNGGAVAFEGNGSFPQNGIYTAPSTGGSASLVANTSTAVPSRSGFQFSGFNSPVVGSDGTVVFQGTSAGGFQGLYSSSGGTLTALVDSNVMMPGTSDNFAQIGGPSVATDGSVVFRGQGSTLDPVTGVAPTGIYKSDGGMLSILADLNTMTPDGVGDFIYFTPAAVAVSGANFAFLAYDEFAPMMAREGLYVSRNGEIIPIMFLNEMFDGRMPSIVLIGRNSLEGDTLAFSVGYTDQTWGVYTATISPAAVPEPSSFALLGLLGIGTVANRYRKRRRAA